ncbi:hypothetical protein [Prescottella sp. R16]|uniref:hypothetical protein n=1 Tax=Prescottella sp. R16 TaxID=3064529 RepID=UPI00272ED93F|nr:hypothetical protein [Prescottella sp. R16]
MTRTPSAASPEVVTYDGLPASAGGAHSLRVGHPGKAFERVRHFVDACTESMSAPSWVFRVAADGPLASTGQLTGFATERFGGPRRRARTHTEWNVRPEFVDDALEVLAAAGADAVTSYGGSLAVLAGGLSVRLVDPDVGTPYPDVTPDAFGRFVVDGYGRLLGDSGIRVTLGTAGSALSLWLNLPADRRLAPGARHLQDNLPFRLSAKRWRIWRPTRAGDSYRSGKIPAPL